MQVRELIEELKKYESDTEVRMIFPSEHSVTIGDIAVQSNRYKNKMVLIRYVAENVEWPECMMGGHDEGCMCNLGFTPRWR